MADVKQQIADRKQRIQALREQIAAAKATELNRQYDAHDENTLARVEAEEARLLLELASLNGDAAPVEPVVVGEYVVPAGTLSVDTDVIAVDPEDVAPVAPAPAPFLPPPPPSPFGTSNNPADGDDDSQE